MPRIAQWLGRATWKLLAPTLLAAELLTGCAPLQHDAAGFREALIETKSLASPSGGPITPQAQQIDRSLQR
ncbi:MAG: hypothetical protein HYS13_25625 [Planctomycetia bacterium]|nr:hypothetical protein [Planctomycetia bacterium]